MFSIVLFLCKGHFAGVQMAVYRGFIHKTFRAFVILSRVSDIRLNALLSAPIISVLIKYSKK